jgi:integrase
MTKLGVTGRHNEGAAWVAFERLRTERPTTVTVRRVIDAFLSASAAGVEPPVLDQYDRFLSPFADRFGHLPVATLTPEQVEAYSRNPDPPPKSKRKPKWNDNSRSKFLSTVSRAFRFAERSRLIDRTPLVGLSRPPQGSRAADVLISADEFDRLYAAATDQFRPLLRLVWLTGCRPSEAAQLTAADVDPEKGLAVVRKHKTKKWGKRRVLYLPPEAVTLLAECVERRPTGFLFRTRKGNRWDWRAMGQAMRAARKRAGLDGKIMYGCRHSFATQALEDGEPDSVVAALLGNTVRTLHSNYSHVGAQRRLLLAAAGRIRTTKKPSAEAEGHSSSAGVTVGHLSAVGRLPSCAPTEDRCLSLSEPE